MHLFKRKNIVVRLIFKLNSKQHLMILTSIIKYNLKKYMLRFKYNKGKK
jgi:hypothetical protein